MGSPHARVFDGIDSVTVRDSMTVVFWFAQRYPQQFFDATYHMRILPEHILRDVPRRELASGEFARHPIGSGPFTRALATADPTIPQIPHDPAQARKILDSLGWRDRNGDGVRERNGRPLRFTIATPSTSQNRYRMAILVQDMLDDLGVRVDVQQMDINPFMSHAMSRTFDVLFSATHYDPSPASIRQSSQRHTWASTAGWSWSSTSTVDHPICGI